MERFIEFEEEVTMDELQKVLQQHNPGVFILRFSKLTGAFKIKHPEDLSKRDLKRAFAPYKVKKIYDDFPLKGFKR